MRCLIIGWGGSKNVLRVVGEGREVRFCNSKWVGEESLGKKFNRMYLHLEQKNGSIF